MKKRKTPANSRGVQAAVYVPSAIKPAGVSLLVGTAVFSAVLMLFALIMSLQDLPVMLFGSMSVAALILGCAVSGFCMGRFMRASGLMYGSACGAVLYGFVFIISLGIGEEVGLAALLKLIIAMLSGAIGGVVGVNMRIRHRK